MHGRSSHQSLSGQISRISAEGPSWHPWTCQGAPDGFPCCGHGIPWRIHGAGIYANMTGDIWGILMVNIAIYCHIYIYIAYMDPMGIVWNSYVVPLKIGLWSSPPLTLWWFRKPKTWSTLGRQEAIRLGGNDHPKSVVSERSRGCVHDSAGGPWAPTG